jgi:UDP-N-acetylmuramoylalanine--D-glutamate ligase
MERLDLPKRALVLGLARSGTAASTALERRGVEVVGADRRLGNDEDLRLLDDVGLLVKSPGVAAEHALVVEARRRGVPVWGEVELGWRLLDNPVVGVTGTNGKTTTSELLGAIFAAAGVAVQVVGNIGRPLTGLDGEAGPGAWIICELSSFQLEDVLTFRPAVAVILNLEPDHLDRHGTLERYTRAKLRIFENQTRRDTAVVPRGFGEIPGQARRVEFRFDDALPAEPLIPGDHNRENAAAACAAARAVGIENDAIGDALSAFPGVPHRLERVGEIAGVRYVNDSKATNVAACLRALAAYAGVPTHLIVGGRGKGESFEPLAAAIGPNVRSIYLVGESAGEIGEAIGWRGTAAGDLETAVSLAAGIAARGDVVLLSPACASFDQFENFEHRGEEFRRLVQNLER